MKAQKLMSLDIDLIQKLRTEDNASYVVNELLREHYDDTKYKKDPVKRKAYLLQQIALKKLEQEFEKKKEEVLNG